MLHFLGQLLLAGLFVFIWRGRRWWGPMWAMIERDLRE